MKARLLAMAGLLLAASSPLAASAKVDMVVMEARGVKLQPGQVIDGSANLTLADGQQVSLMMQDGKVVKLRGPYDKPAAPEAAAAGANVQLALQLLVTQQSSRERAGVSRGTAGQSIPPEPWLVDVSNSGQGLRCLEADSSITLWRPDSSSSVPVEVAPNDRSWKADAEWKAGSDRLPLPHNVPLRRRTAYVVRVNGKDTNITLISLPTSLTNDAMRASFMMENGCDAQAKALFAKAGLSIQ